MLAQFKQFVDEINANNSRNYKIDVLKKWKDNESVKYFLKFVFDPFIVTGISKKKLDKIMSYENTKNRQDYINACEYVKVHNSGKDSDLKFLADFCQSSLNKELGYLFNDILIKTLSIGVDAKTINKVFDNLIPTFSVQLANKYFDNPKKLEGKKFVLTTKIDGGRIIAIKKNGNVKFFTRQGQLYEGLVDLETEFKTTFPDNVCLDGEITLLNSGELVSKDQYKATMKITRSDGVKHGVKMLVFDCMTATEFEKQKCKTPYYERMTNLRKMFNENEHTYFSLIPVLYEGRDTNKVKEYLDLMTSKGEEGVMINVWDAPYSFSRTWNLIKVKKFQSCDLRVCGFEEGSGKYKETLGSILCEYKGGIVGVGTGLSDEIRDHIWANRNSYNGTIIEVSYFEETKGADGQPSLRFPAFVDFRPDKNEPNY